MSAADRTLNWAREQVLASPTRTPAYGSQAWWDEPNGVVRRMSILAAAECWRRDSLPDEIARRLEVELQVARDEEDRHYALLHADAQAMVRSVTRLPRYAEKRARELEAAKPRPGDWPGTGPLRLASGGEIR